MIISDTKETMLLLARYMARDGMDLGEIAKELGITKKKLLALLDEDGELKKDVLYSKKLTQFRIEDALIKRATGTTAVEIKKTEKDGKTETVTITKDIPADSTALLFWLKNRYPDRWREKIAQNSDTNEKLCAIMEGIDLLAEENAGGEKGK